ncbi:MAG: class I cytochrome c [Betaproteobacteria bacterium HGW-Betaproteobacteria-22]|nr:MAG: class I cytochrome c [Betaproteobacteria bacterium HGW-Betaproteobacteria-22]
MNPFIIRLILISSVAAPVLGIAAEDIVTSAHPAHIPTLAASCSACHGTLGNAVKSGSVVDATPLAGESDVYLEQRLLDFRAGTRESTVMHHHAKGLTPEEIHQLALFFSRQEPEVRVAPTPQKLKAVNHE